jgi:hypothetical protein
MGSAVITNTVQPHLLCNHLVQMATQIVGSLLALEALDEEEDIRLYINSPGAARHVPFGYKLAAHGTSLHAHRDCCTAAPAMCIVASFQQHPSCLHKH